MAQKNAVDPHPSLRATLSHKERENNKWGLWTQTDVSSHAVVSVGMKRLFVTLKSASNPSITPSPFGERVAAGRVRVDPRELLLKMSKLYSPMLQRGPNENERAINASGEVQPR